MTERPKAPHDDMPAEIDFSKGIRGKFAKPGTTLKLPVYLDPDVEASLAARAAARGIDVGELVDELLKEHIELMKEAR